MTPSNRAGGTVEPEVDSSAEVVANGDRDPTGNGNGHGEPDDEAPTKRRSTLLTNGVPMPERGSASQRGTSSSLIAKPAPSSEEAGHDEETAATINGDLEPPSVMVPV